MSEAGCIGYALTVSPTANKELGQRRVSEEGADQKDFERYGYRSRRDVDVNMNEPITSFEVCYEVFAVHIVQVV